MYVRQMLMNFSYSDAFGEFPATAYETLLLDAMLGDLTLFNRRDAVDLSWQILEPVMRKLAATGVISRRFRTMRLERGAQAAADALLTRDGRNWKNPVNLGSFDVTGASSDR